MNESKIINPHDRAFRASMANKQVAIEFFEQHLPEAIQQAIDFASLSLCPESYIDQELRLQVSDVLYAVTIKGQPGYLYILCEHQTTPDKWMAFRIMKYMLAIMDRHLKQNPKTDGLPLVFPLVFYNGQNAYRHSTDIKDFILAPRELIDAFLFKPFLLIDASKLEDEALRERYWAGLMQFIFKHIYTREIMPYVQQFIDLWGLIEQDGGKDYIITLASYLSKAGESQNGEAVLELIAEHVTKETGEKIMTIAEQIEQKAEARGYLAGIAEGKAEGKAQGEAAILVRLLKRKFHMVPEQYLQRIQQADADTLLVWGENLLEAETLSEVFQ